MIEMELKLLLDDAGAEKLRKAATARGARPENSTLLTRYFDTAEKALGRAGIALRMRREKRRWTQTVKVRERHTGGLSSAREADAPAPGGRIDIARIPEEDLRLAVEDAVNGHDLAPVFETDIKRARFRLSPDGTSQVELAIDLGEIRAGDRSALHREAEFELISGDPGALFTAARGLIPEGGLVFSTRSKAERGALLAAEGRIGDPTEPRKSRVTPLDPDMTAEAAAQAVLAECLDQVAANAEAVRAGDDPEGPHQLRIGLRRLRSALKLWRGPLGGGWLADLEGEARWLGAEVGRLRDLDVTLHDLVAPAARAAPDEPGFAPLAAAVEARAGIERAHLRETLRGPRVQGFLFDLSEFIALRRWLDPSDHEQTGRLAEPISVLAARELDAVWHRAARRAKGIDHLDIEARHELRKALKTLRYAVEFFAPLASGKKVAAVVKPLRALQDLFGNLNDLAMAEAMFMTEDAFAGGNPAAARAAGRVIGARAALAEEDWQTARDRWHALKSVKPFWR
ncbi:CHAD domain-containing protein [Limibaculum sp. M0105]|uniref:CHAD domain-containing protein n=1 Tax=Thermohalobaculum xanthum TaxID=2753746 RepID=A0A8J7M3N5_9RHOB|nr:CYTH and CHAD domain-containing protein [Thermohalobaculum xanthum]MBK0397639.1 CHAD domain-containing protein [Thermohalobaculum xanthum]